jgi:hypothetical protein
VKIWIVRDTTTVIIPTAAKIRLTVLGCKLLKAFDAAEVTEDRVVFAGAGAAAAPGVAALLIYIMAFL